MQDELHILSFTRPQDFLPPLFLKSETTVINSRAVIGRCVFTRNNRRVRLRRHLTFPQFYHQFSAVD